MVLKLGLIIFDKSRFNYITPVYIILYFNNARKYFSPRDVTFSFDTKNYVAIFGK